MNRIIPLWSGEAPYTDASPDRFQPFIKEFKVDGSRGAVIVCPGGSYVETADLRSNNQKTGDGDTIHFCREDLQELGRRYFEAYRQQI